MGLEKIPSKIKEHLKIQEDYSLKESLDKFVKENIEKTGYKKEDSNKL